MIQLGELRRHSKELNSVDDASRRQAIHSLGSYEEQEWATVPPEVIRTLVDSLQRQLLNGGAQTSTRRQILIILGNIGPSSEPVIPTLIELLQEGVADDVREEAATALGKIGKKARTAVDHLIKLGR